MIVISDATLVISFLKINRLDLLETLLKLFKFQKVFLQNLQEILSIETKQK